MGEALGFIVTLGVLVTVHEWGHYQVARWCGVKVLRFSWGMGRVLWRWQRRPGDTEWVISALPLGGYVKFLDTREGPVDASLRTQAFDQQSLPRRAAIVAAGPLINLLLAVLILAGVGMWGRETLAPILASPPPGSAADQQGLHAGDEVLAFQSEAQGDWQELADFGQLRWQVHQAWLNHHDLRLRVRKVSSGGVKEIKLDIPQAPPETRLDSVPWESIGLVAGYAEPVIDKVIPGGAAQRAGLMAGDRVRRVDEQEVPDAAWLRQRIQRSPGLAMQWSVERAGQRLAMVVTPDAIPEKDGQMRGRIQVTLGAPPPTVTQQLGPVDALVQGMSRTWQMASLSLRMLGRMLVGEASLKNLSGPLSIAEGASQSAQRGPIVFLEFLALVSLSLGVLNLLPVPLLDGGHLMYYLFEAATGRPPSDAWLEWLQRGGLLVLLLLMTVALSNDLVHRFGGP